MGHTNSTANLALPQFIGTDKPTWLGDINGAFAAIDAYAGTNDAAVSAAVADASSAVSQASNAVNTANTANTTAGNASTAANNAVGVANTANAIAGTVDAKVGILANLNTTDRTSIVNAINEIEGEVNPGSVSVTADGIKTYADLIEDLYALTDFSKFNKDSKASIDGSLFDADEIGANIAYFTRSKCASTLVAVNSFTLTNNNPRYFNSQITTGGTTITELTSNVPTSGIVIAILY